jgi:hypothetical protein
MTIELAGPRLSATPSELVFSGVSEAEKRIPYNPSQLRSIRSGHESTLLPLSPPSSSASPAAGGDSVLAAFDQTALAAIFSVGSFFGLAPD